MMTTQRCFTSYFVEYYNDHSKHQSEKLEDSIYFVIKITHTRTNNCSLNVQLLRIRI